MMDTGSTTLQVSTADEDRVIPVDVEHQGIRLALPLLMVVGFVIGYILTSSLFNIVDNEIAVGCVPVIGAVIFALVLAAGGERVLKRTWHSGRSLLLNQSGLDLHDQRKGRQAQMHIDWAQRVNVLSWRFSVRRGSARIPKGWNMLALQLLQDDTLVTLYTFMPDKDAKAMPDFDVFKLLVPRAQLESNDMPLRDKIEQRRLHKAEDARWEDGAELRRQDFQALMETFTQRVSNWQEQP
jgi:hypothetical protein